MSKLHGVEVLVSWKKVTWTLETGSGHAGVLGCFPLLQPSLLLLVLFAEAVTHAIMAGIMIFAFILKICIYSQDSSYWYLGVFFLSMEMTSRLLASVSSAAVFY